MTPNINRKFALGVAALAATVALAACSAAEEPTTTTAAPGPQTVEVTALDYGFSGLPERVAPGTVFTLLNDSGVEIHELVAIPLPADETRPVAELIADPEGLAAYFGSVETVLIAPPNEGSVAVEGTGALNTPGRYAIICAIPTGADPAEYLAAAAAAEGGPPQVAGGPPHFVKGMWGEVVVAE
ncbi:MAG: hypothetical protein GY720_12175 [bacterium]|nr:hypothetical protein [bacterium]